MRFFSSAIMSAVALLAPCAAKALAQEIPRPSRAPTHWELKFTFHDPQRVWITLPGDDNATLFWYMLYRVENDTGRDVQFFPQVELVSHSLEVIEGGDRISPSVYDAIKERHKVTHPFLLEPRQVTGILLQGEDNARNSVIVFRQFNPRDNDFTIFFSGLSGEIQRLRNPNFDISEPESDDNPRSFTLRKTLAIRYKLPGDPNTRQIATPVRVGHEWTMR